MVAVVTDIDFDSVVTDHDQPVVLKFWADWCGPCKGFAPVVDQLEVENPGITFGSVNVDTETNLTSTFGITSIPALVFLGKEGQVEFFSGAASKSVVQQFLTDAQQV